MEQDYIDKRLDASIIKINNKENIYEVGTVVSVKDFIIEVSGMENVMFYEKVNIANKAIGYVSSINEDFVTIAILKLEEAINVGDIAYSTNTLYTGSYSPSSIGRIIDLFGEDKLSSKKFDDLIDIPIERKTIPIMDRGTVNRPLLTGITGIDLLYPIGKGQRQLIIGDKRTGKTQIGLDTIVNQKDKNVLCFYVAIGKTKKEVKNIYFELAKRGALSYTTIITAFNDELPPVISLIPYFALSVAEDYMMKGYDVLCVIDDLKRHAEAYREISLISGKTPGRDAYPADIFYTHSRLLEKGCQHKNGGSITILPIVETKGGDITDYISTNIISITDGQLVLSAKSFQKGEKPAINYGLSVSRLGGAVQDSSMKKYGSIVRRKLLSYLETRSVYELVNIDEMSSELKNQFMEGKFILDNLGQYKFSPKNPEEIQEIFGCMAEENQIQSEQANKISIDDIKQNAVNQEEINKENDFQQESVAVPKDQVVEEPIQENVVVQEKQQIEPIPETQSFEPLDMNNFQMTPVEEPIQENVVVQEEQQIESVPETQSFEPLDMNNFQMTPVEEPIQENVVVQEKQQIEPIPETQSFEPLDMNNFQMTPVEEPIQENVAVPNSDFVQNDDGDLI